MLRRHSIFKQAPIRLKHDPEAIELLSFCEIGVEDDFDDAYADTENTDSDDEWHSNILELTITPYLAVTQEIKKSFGKNNNEHDEAITKYADNISIAAAVPIAYVGAFATSIVAFFIGAGLDVHDVIKRAREHHSDRQYNKNKL